MTEKFCLGCLTHHPADQFGKGKSRCRANLAAVQKRRNADNPEHVKRIRREAAARARANPVQLVKVRANEAKYRAGGGDRRQYEKLKQRRAVDPFWWRARLLRASTGNRSITPDALRAIWDAQGGACALTGRAMTMAEAEVDHVIPVTRGGTHDLSNLRWALRVANRAKGNMTDAEFIGLCRDVSNQWANR